MASKAYDAGVKEYRDMYWTPEYVPLDTCLLYTSDAADD